MTPGIGKTFSCPDLSRSRLLSRLSVTKRYPLYFAAPHDLACLFPFLPRPVFTPSCHKRLLATLPGPLSLHCSQIARASLGPRFHRGGLHLRSCRFRVEDFERAACQDIDEKNDIPARSREWILQRTALEREKKLRISPLFAFLVGLLRRNNVAVSFVDSEHRRCLSKSFSVLRNDRCI